jgi:hypothetical protein
LVCCVHQAAEHEALILLTSVRTYGLVAVQMQVGELRFFKSLVAEKASSYWLILSLFKANLAYQLATTNSPALTRMP